MKKYNIFELRFLQILVPKKQHDLIMLYQFFIRAEETLWRGTEVNNKEKKELLIKIGETLESSASKDYLDSIIEATKYIKDDIAKGCGLTVKELFGGKEDEL